MTFYLDPSACKDIKFIQTLEVVIDGNRTVYASNKVINLPNWRMSDTMLDIWYKVMYGAFDETIRVWLTNLFAQIMPEE